MASLREQILQRLVVALTGATSAVSVTRSREVSIKRTDTPAIVIQAGSADLVRMATGADKTAFDVRLEIFVRDDPWDSAVDPVDTAMHAVVMSDAGLAALITDVRRISEAFESQEADATAGTLTVTYRFTWLANARDISKPAI